VLELGQSLGWRESRSNEEVGHATMVLDYYYCRSHHCISIAFDEGTQEKITPF